MAASVTAVDLPRRPQKTRPGPILLVEDDFSIRRTMAEVLGEEGYEVVCAADGLEALSLLCDQGIRPSLIILDLWLPRMDGVQFRSQQKALAGHRDVPVLVITAARFLPRELKDLGLHFVLRKPLDLGQLLSATKRLTRQDPVTTPTPRWPS